MRTDRNRNPTAFTTDLAKQAGLREGIDYERGDPFPDNPPKFWTAKLRGDPVVLTIQVIDKLGFYNKQGAQRWTYIALPAFVWASLTPAERRQVIGWMYGREGGTDMKPLFA